MKHGRSENFHKKKRQWDVADGTIEQYKAKFLAQGYTQTYGVDYSETFLPVAKIDMIQILF